MLRTLLRFFSPAAIKLPSAEATRSTAANKVVLYAQLDQSRRNRRGRGSSHDPAAEVPSSQRSDAATAGLAARVGSEAVNHRARLMAMQIEHTRLCSRKRCRQLGQMGVVTAGDLATANLRQVATGFARPRKAEEILKRYRRAIRLSAAVPGMMPRDAQLLISIHRRSVRGLALESAAVLHRDLERFAESTPGRQQLRGRRLPSVRRLKRWIAACQSHAARRPVHVAAI